MRCPSRFSDDQPQRTQIGSAVNLTVMRRDQIRNFEVSVGQEEPVTYVVKQKSDATDPEKKIFRSWLSEK